MSVRSLSTNDIEEFYPVFSSVLQTEFPGYAPTIVKYLLTRIYTAPTFKFWLQREEKCILGAYHNNQIIGFAVIDSPYGGVSLCRWLGVQRDYQRKGYGTALIRAWNESAMTQKTHKMEVAGQPKSKEFYEKMGFAHEGLRKKSYFGIDQYLFGKVIAEPNAVNMTQ